MSYQMCHAVRFLHSAGVVHTDLKPENVLFTYTNYCKVDAFAPHFKGQIRRMTHAHVKLIDFGSAVYVRDGSSSRHRSERLHHNTVTTRHYRAPEVVCKLGWSCPSDVWALACIVFELATGVTMFQTHEDREHLAMMEYIIGPMPASVARHAESMSSHFRNGSLDWDRHSSGARYIRDNCRTLESYMLSPMPGGPANNSVDYPDTELGSRHTRGQLYDLLRSLFIYEPNERRRLDSAVGHEYFDALPPEMRIRLSAHEDSGFRSLSPRSRSIARRDRSIEERRRRHYHHQSKRYSRERPPLIYAPPPRHVARKRSASRGTDCESKRRRLYYP